MQFIIGSIIGCVVAAIFVAYRLRGDRTVTEAVTDVVRLGPVPRNPR